MERNSHPHRRLFLEQLIPKGDRDARLRDSVLHFVVFLFYLSKVLKKAGKKVRSFINSLSLFDIAAANISKGL